MHEQLVTVLMTMRGGIPLTSALILCGLILGVFLFKKRALRRSNRARASNGDSTTFRGFKYAASLGLLGRPDPSDNIIWHTSISVALSDTYKLNGGKPEFSSSEPAQQIYRKVIAKHPQFPFAYGRLAHALNAIGDSSWRDYAQQAVAILEKTTRIDGHHPDHDAELEMLRTKLGHTG